MGFSQYRFGNIHECWIEDGLVCQEMPCTKQVYKYPTRLTDNIPRQLNIFSSFNVAFLLYHEDKMYIGRNDGWISIYRADDGLLVGLNNWDAPNAPITSLIGFFNSTDGIRDVYLDMRDKQTIYSTWRRAEARLTLPFDGSYTDIIDIESYAPAPTLADWYLYSKGGERIGVDVWSVQEALWREDCKVFL